MTSPDPQRAPEHLVELTARAFPPSALHPHLSREKHFEAHLAQARRIADQIWAEAFHHGAGYGLSIAPARLLIEMPPGGLPGAGR